MNIAMIGILGKTCKPIHDSLKSSVEIEEKVCRVLCVNSKYGYDSVLSMVQNHAYTLPFENSRTIIDLLDDLYILLSQGRGSCLDLIKGLEA